VKKQLSKASSGAQDDDNCVQYLHAVLQKKELSRSHIFFSAKLWIFICYLYDVFISKES